MWLGRDVRAKETDVTPETDPDVLAADTANFQAPPRAIVPYDGYDDEAVSDADDEEGADDGDEDE